MSATLNVSESTRPERGCPSGIKDVKIIDPEVRGNFSTRKLFHGLINVTRLKLLTKGVARLHWRGQSLNDRSVGDQTIERTEAEKFATE